MNTEAYDILLLDLERTLRRLDDIDIMWAHRELVTKAERKQEAYRDANDLEDCKAELDTIYDMLRQLKVNAA